MTTTAPSTKPTSTLTVIDHLSPEQVAMLQALYSRSAAPVAQHLARMTKERSGRFMSEFYVGYTHKSIGDCGSTTMFIENVSLLAAKAIQDWPLYCGQETSTRYIDMAKQPIVDPVGTHASKAILDRWMDFYVSRQARVQAHVRATHPRKEGEDEKKYDGAVKARAFDILRGFLPAGIATQLSWHSNLRQAGDHLIGLGHHPTAEVRGLAARLRAVLAAKYPDSGFATNMPTVSGEAAGRSGVERQLWEERAASLTAYREPPFGAQIGFNHTLHEDDCLLLSDGAIGELIRTRPRGCVLPHCLSALGPLTYTFHMDFGSFRDLQRHRHGVCLMPLLTTEYGFEPWYLDQLDAETRADAVRLVDAQASAIASVDASPADLQYLTALGFRVLGSVSYGLPAMVYVMELRSGKTIHPTLRRHVLRIVESFRAAFPMVPVHADTDVDDWTVRRGGQTIARRDGAAL
jgi:thymidylate synthase ThyX